MEPVHGEGSHGSLGAEDTLREHEKLLPSFRVVMVGSRGQCTGEHLGPEVAGACRDVAESGGLASLDVGERWQGRTCILTVVSAGPSPTAWVGATAGGHTQATDCAPLSVVGSQPVGRNFPRQGPSQVGVDVRVHGGKICPARRSCTDRAEDPGGWPLVDIHGHGRSRKAEPAGGGGTPEVLTLGAHDTTRRPRHAAPEDEA
eukprot:s60_g49.t1